MPELPQIFRALLAIEARLEGIERKLHAIIRGDNPELNKLREELRVSGAVLTEAVAASAVAGTTPPA